MSEPVFAALLEACGVTLEQLDASKDERPYDFVVSEKVATLVNRAIEDERRRCIEITNRETWKWRTTAGDANADPTIRTLAAGSEAACRDIARLIGEGL